MGLLLLVLIVILLVGAFPRAGSYNANWGYGPTGLLGLILIIVLIVLLFEYLPFYHFNF